MSSGRYGGINVRYIDTGSREAAHAVGTWLSEQLDPTVAEIRIQSGFYSGEALGPFRQTFASLAATNGIARIVIGSNDGGTLRAHLDDLIDALGLPRSRAHLGLVYYAGAYFHPKTYHIVRTDGSQAAYVGSANLTLPGIGGRHVEAGVILDTREGDPDAVLRAISGATDAWFQGERDGLELIAGAGDVQRLLDDGVIRTTAPPRAPRPSGSAGQPPQRPALAQLVVFPPALAPAAPAAARPAPAWHALPTELRTPLYPPYMFFAPAATEATVGASALTGSGLGDAVGIIFRISRVGDKHWRLADGTADISIPVSAAATLRFGIFGPRSRPRAEFDLDARYVDDALTLVAPEARAGIMSFGFTPGDKGHADLRLALPRAPIINLREQVLGQGKKLPEAGELAILEWPTPQKPNFRLTFTHPTSMLGLTLTGLWQAAAAAGRPASKGAVWLPVGVAPAW